MYPDWIERCIFRLAVRYFIRNLVSRVVNALLGQIMRVVGHVITHCLLAHRGGNILVAAEIIGPNRFSFDGLDHTVHLCSPLHSLFLELALFVTNLDGSEQIRNGLPVPNADVK